MPYWLESLLNNPFVTGGALGVAAVLVVLVLLTRQPRRFRAFDTAGGEVLVTRKAVRELVQRCCEELGDVGSARVEIRLRGGEVRVGVRLRVRKSANLKGISGYLREQISTVLTENLGIERLGEIGILVVGILPDPERES